MRNRTSALLLSSFLLAACSSQGSSQGGSSASGHLALAATSTSAAPSRDPAAEPTDVPCEGATTVAKAGVVARTGSKPERDVVVFDVAPGAEKPKLCRSVEDPAAAVYVNVVGGEAGVVTSTDVTDVARATVKPALEALGGRVTLVRGADLVLAIHVDQARREKLGVELKEIVALMRTTKEPALPKIGELVIPGHTPTVRLSDVATIEVAVEELRTPTALAPGGAVLAVRGMDPAPVLRARVDEAIAKLASSMPPTVKVSRMSFSAPR